MRSLVVMMSIAVGLWAGLTAMSFSFGMYQGHIQNVILYQLSHIQVHHPGFRSEMELKDTVRNSLELQTAINSMPDVKATVRRCISPCMILTSSGSSGVMLVGTPVSDERKVTGLDSMVVDGSFFADSSRKEMLLGSKLAEKIHGKVGSKVVVMLQDANNEMVSGAFRVKGIYKTRNSAYDESMVFIPLNRMQELAALGDVSNELAVLLNEGASLEQVRTQISSLSHGEEVLDWMGLSPELDLVVNSFDLYMYIFMGIILMALMFGIVNTMLMAVLERQRELGMLMAIGMNRLRIFAMVMLETIWLALVGGPLGLLLGHATIRYFGTHGVNLSQYSEALSRYGFSNVIYFQLDQKYYWPVLLMTIGVAVVSAVYPAIKAVRLEPTQAIRKI